MSTPPFRLPPPNAPMPRRRIYSGVTGAIARAVDAAVGAFLPSVAHGMRKARVKSEALLAYEAAQITRTNPIRRTRSADGEILPDLDNLRSSARDTVQNDADSEALVRCYEDNVVGGGIRPQAMVEAQEVGVDEEQVAAWRKACEREWERWSTEEADATGAGTFYDLQRLVARTRKVDGEVLGHAIKLDNSLACELIDCDRLGSSFLQDTDRIKGGVEIDAAGRPIAYHIAPLHPDDAAGNTALQRVPASDGGLSIVQHIFRRTRPGQHRGVPDLASAMLYKRHLHHYLNSELIAARTSSSYALFIEKQIDASDPDVFPVQAEEAGQTDNYHEVVEPGTIQYLNEGEKPVPFSPNRPGTAFDPFVTRVLRAIAASQGVAYELVAKDFGSMNYSSARAMLLECRRTFDTDRTLLCRQFCTPWWRNVILTAIAAGRIQPPRRFMENLTAWLRVRWVAPAYGWVDPTKEIEASTMAIAANLSTPYDEAARSGMEAESILEARARFMARAAELERQFQLPPGSLLGGSAPNGEAQRMVPPGSTDMGEGLEGAEPSDMTSATMATKDRLDALGLAVRSGLLSPSEEVEEQLRSEFELPPMAEAVREAWGNNPVRRPVTIAGPSDDAPVPVVEQQQDKPQPAPAVGGEPAEDEDEEDTEPQEGEDDDGSEAP